MGVIQFDIKITISLYQPSEPAIIRLFITIRLCYPQKYIIES